MRSFSTSSAHKGLWLAQTMSSDTLDHALVMWDVDGEVDQAVMESAFRHVLGEAEVLRVNFVEEDGELRQVPRELGDWRPFFMDLGAERDPEQAAREALADVVAEPFDLERDLLFRMGLVRLAPARSLVVLCYNHLISDGYGAGGLLSRRLAEVYTALARGSQVPQLPQPWDVESFAAGAAGYGTSPAFAEDTDFWREYLADAPAPAHVPRIALSEARRSELSERTSSADRWSQLADAIGMVSRTLTVPRAEADLWSESAEANGLWLSSLLTAAAAVYFRHRCDQPDVLFALAVGNRAGSAATTPALAVNVVPVRVEVPLGATFTEVADAVADQTYEIFDHTACHYSEIQRASETVLTDRGSFGTVINIVEFVEPLQFAGRPARYLGATTGAFGELAIGIFNDESAGGDLLLRLDAPASLYSSAELRFIGAELVSYIRSVTAGDADLPIGALDVLSGSEREQVLNAAKDTGVPMPGLTVPQLFARQVEEAPDAVAVVSGDSTVTYAELDRRSSRLAGALRRQGVGAEAVVAVALPRSADLAAALLGVAKAGAAHLPIDPALPAQLTGSVASDASAQVLLTDAATAAALPADLDVPVVLFGALDDSDDAPGLRAEAHPDSLLAVLYSSGGAGAAAGVALTHRNLERFVLDRHWQDGSRGSVLWHSPHTADTLALELWVPLLNGGRVVVAPPGELGIDSLTELRAANESSVLPLPGGLFSAIAAERPESLAGLHEVWTTGDRVAAAAVRRVRQACPELTVVTGHGPTEATGFAACHRLVPGGPEDRVGAIGGPADHTALYVLGPGLAPVPAGVAGELYVAGPGVARGWRGQPGPTAERFVPCPFGPAGARLYRTGDLVRRGADGLLEYVGRAGVQAQVRGVRVEPTEIEELLSEHPGLARSVVVVRNDDSGQQRVVAYVVPAGGPGAGPSGEELRQFAAGRLPEFLVPVFVVLKRLPVTADGRVDRVSLPEPEFGDGQYQAPRNRTEQVLADAFAEVLEVARVGIDEDFFDLGGNSLRAIRLVGLIRTELNLEVSIRTLFAARTIIGLSNMWDDLSRSSRPALRRRTREGAMV